MGSVTSAFTRRLWLFRRAIAIVRFRAQGRRGRFAVQSSCRLHPRKQTFREERRR